jgi:dTDP-glucose 4,6-dehydratase
VLQACKEHSTKKLIITSTSEVYGSALHVPIDESHPLQGQSPYSASKISADKMAESFYRSFDIPIAVARPFNTYGPRQSARAIIPAIIIQLLSGNKKCKVGSLEPIRDFVYIKDTVEGFAAIARSDNTVGETINIASQSGISIGDLAKKIIKMIKPGASLMFDKKRVRPKNSEVKRLLGSRKKIAELTGWKTFYTLDEGLEETIDWFRDNLNKYKTDAYNI